MKLAPINVNIRKNLPKTLIYKAPKSDSFVLFTTKKPKVVGRMKMFPFSVKSSEGMYISSIETYPKRQGFGTDLINFAKNYSKQQGYKGNLSADAGLTFQDMKNPSHLFFRKQGFICDDNRLLKKMDSFIEQNKQLDPLEVKTTTMYYFG